MQEVQGGPRADTADVSIVVPVINETFSLEQTVDIVVGENRVDLAEILIVIAERTTEASRETIAGLVKKYPDLVVVHTQRKPYIGGALQEAFALARGRWTVLMASDLETDPHLVKTLIAEARRGGAEIVTASRWISGGSFEGYHPLKLAFNWTFQRLMGLVFLTSLSDMTYGFRIFRTDVLRDVRWEEAKHGFLLETLVKPMRLGARVREIPVHWTPRPEGASQMTLPTYWGYIRIALKTRFRPRRSLQVSL